jgi:hypothetical protein
MIVASILPIRTLYSNRRVTCVDHYLLLHHISRSSVVFLRAIVCILKVSFLHHGVVRGEFKFLNFAESSTVVQLGLVVLKEGQDELLLFAIYKYELLNETLNSLRDLTSIAPQLNSVFLL